MTEEYPVRIFVFPSVQTSTVKARECRSKGREVEGLKITIVYERPLQIHQLHLRIVSHPFLLTSLFSLNDYLFRFIENSGKGNDSLKKRGLEVRFNDRKSAAFRDSCVWRQGGVKRFRGLLKHPPLAYVGSPEIRNDTG